MMKLRSIPHLLLFSAFVLLMMKNVAPMSVHIIMHRKWIVSFMRGKIANKGKNRLMFITAIVLLLATINSLVTGVLISSRVLPEVTAALSPGMRSFFVVMHVVGAHVILGVVLLHLVLNIKRMRSWFAAKQSRPVKSTT